MHFASVGHVARKVGIATRLASEFVGKLRRSGASRQCSTVARPVGECGNGARLEVVADTKKPRQREAAGLWEGGLRQPLNDGGDLFRVVGRLERLEAP